MESLETDYDAAPRPTDLEVGDGASDLNSANGSTGHKLDNFFSGLRYVRPSDGKVIPLALQSFRDPSHFPQTSQWLRLGKPPSMGTPIGKLSYWVGSSIMENGSQNQRFGPAAVGQAVVRLIIAWPVSCILVCKIFDNASVVNNSMADSWYRDLAPPTISRYCNATTRDCEN